MVAVTGNPGFTSAVDPDVEVIQTPTPEAARQGRNIRGMLAVLVVSIVVLIAAYGVMLALLGGHNEAEETARAQAAAEASEAAPAAGQPQP